MNPNDDTRLIVPASKVVDHELAYWRAELALDAAMTQHMERLLSRVRQSAEMQMVKSEPPAPHTQRAGCLGILFSLIGR